MDQLPGSQAGLDLETRAEVMPIDSFWPLEKTITRVSFLSKMSGGNEKAQSDEAKARLYEKAGRPWTSIVIKLEKCWVS